MTLPAGAELQALDHGRDRGRQARVEADVPQGRGGVASAEWAASTGSPSISTRTPSAAWPRSDHGSLERSEPPPAPPPLPPATGCCRRSPAWSPRRRRGRRPRCSTAGPGTAGRSRRARRCNSSGCRPRSGSAASGTGPAESRRSGPLAAIQLLGPVGTAPGSRGRPPSAVRASSVEAVVVLEHLSTPEGYEVQIANAPRPGRRRGFLPVGRTVLGPQVEPPRHGQQVMVVVVDRLAAALHVSPSPNGSRSVTARPPTRFPGLQHDHFPPGFAKVEAPR